MPFSSRSVAVFIIFMLFVGCDSADSSDLQCNLQVGPLTTDGSTAVTFSVTGTGSRDVDTVTFIVGDDEQLVQGPSIPWSVNRIVSSGTVIDLIVSGSVENGSLEAKISGDSSAFGSNASFSSSDSCSSTSA